MLRSQRPFTVNGKPLNEPYIDLGGTPRQYSLSAVLGPGQIWVLGDNRPLSIDSRAWGSVPASGIIGYASAVERGASVTRLRTPPPFVADGLAPVGIIRFAIRRSRARRNLPRGYATYGPRA